MDIALRLVADGTLILILVVTTPLILLWLRTDRWLKLPVLMMAGLTSLLTAKIMSLIYQPALARPFLEHGTAPGAAYINNPGFPSDHAMLATVLVIAVYVATRNKRLAAVLGLLVIIMSLGRVVAQVHTPLDVIFGMVAGISGSVWYRKLTR